jgi:cyclophilin family peptidyl-prolyl cis-trans isomerase
VFLALSDPEFVRPDEADLARRAEEIVVATLGDEVMLQTSIGDFGITLFKNELPHTTRLMKKLIRAGALDGAGIVSVTPSEITFHVNLDEKNADIAANLAPERIGGNLPATVSLCGERKRGELTFSVILAPSADVDSRCIPFARIGPGAETIRRISSSTNPAVITLKKAAFVNAPPAMAMSAPKM